MKKLELPGLPEDAFARSEELRPAYKQSCKILAEYLSGKIQGGDKVKTAAVVVNGYGRLTASETNQLGLRIMAAKTIQGGDDRDEEKNDKIKLLR